MNNDQLSMQRFSFKKPPFTASIEQPFLNDERLIAVKGLNRFLQDKGFAVITDNPDTGKITCTFSITSNKPAFTTK